MKITLENENAALWLILIALVFFLLHNARTVDYYRDLCTPIEVIEKTLD